MKKIFFLFVLILLSLYANAQTHFKLKQKKDYAIVYKNGVMLDTVYAYLSGHRIALVNNRLFTMFIMIPMGKRVRYYIISEHGLNDDDSLKVIHQLSIHTENCIAFKEFDSFKIHFRSKYIMWRLRRDGKIIKGKISYDDFSKMDKFEFPKSMCGLPIEYTW